METLVKQLMLELPPVFAGREVDRLTGMAVRWNTFRNVKYSSECPAGLFIKIGRKILIRRDVFLVWLQHHLSVVN